MMLATTIAVSVSLLQAPTCRTASARVEAVVDAKVRELKGTELCQFRLYHHIHDLDGDGRDDFLMVFSVEGIHGSANATRQFLVAFPSRNSWRPSVVEVGRRGVRVVLALDVSAGGDVVLTTAERNDGDALCCLSGSGQLVFRLEGGRLISPAEVASAASFRGQAAGQDSIAPRARALDWSAGNTARLLELFRDTAVVRNFLNEIDRAGSPGDPGMFEGVREYRFVDLNADGVVELVALADVSGREFFNNIEIVFPTFERPIGRQRDESEFQGFVLRQVHGFEVESLEAALKDLDGDRTYEIVVADTLGPERDRTVPQATVPEIYHWNGVGYEKASAKYRWFYRDVVLPALERQLQKLETLPSPAADPHERVRRQVLRDNYRLQIAEARKRSGRREH